MLTAKNKNLTIFNLFIMKKIAERERENNM